jgi:hypothetical protein
LRGIASQAVWVAQLSVTIIGAITQNLLEALLPALSYLILTYPFEVEIGSVYLFLR